MAQGEAAKRRAGIGTSWAAPTGQVVALTNSGIVVETAIPPEATHVRVFNTSSSILVRIGFDGSTISSVLGVAIGFRQFEYIPIPPNATVLRAVPASTAAFELNVWFLAKSE